MTVTVEKEAEIEQPDVREVFAAYPDPIREKLMLLRRLVMETAAETEGVGALQETLKWNEPSYLTKGGSTIRIAWKSSKPDQYGMYFNCQTSLIDTFKELYTDTFSFEGNRAMVFDLADALPENELRHCSSLALTYHRRKHLHLLGA